MTLLRAMDPKYSDERRPDPQRSTTTGREGRRRPQRRARSKARSRSTTSSIRPTARRPARSSSKRARRSPRTSPKSSALGPRPRVEVMADPKNPLIFNSLAEDTTQRATKKLLLRRSISGCGRATRRSWRRPARCSTKSSTTPNRYRLGKVGRFRINRKLQPERARRPR